MPSDLEGTAGWIEALRGQGISQEMIDEARQGAARMIAAATDRTPDPREPASPEAYAQQLANMAKAKRGAGS